MDREHTASLVIPSYGRVEELAGCLDAIAEHADVEHEVITVTVASDDATQAMLAGRSGDARLRNVVDDRRTGFVRAANRGFRAAGHRFVCQLNDDCRLMPYALGNAINFLSAPANDRVGLAAFFHDSPFRRNIQSEITVEGTRYVCAHVRGLCYANFGVWRRGLGEELGWYDERYFMYGADPDFSLKVWSAGLRVEPCPGALVRHAQLDDERAREERAEQGGDNRLLFEKWGL